MTYLALVSAPTFARKERSGTPPHLPIMLQPSTQTCRATYDVCGSACSSSRVHGCLFVIAPASSSRQVAGSMIGKRSGPYCALYRNSRGTTFSGKLRASLLGRKSAACTPSLMREIIRRKPSTGPVLVMSQPVSSVSADRERPRLRKRRRCKLEKSDLLRPPSRSLASIVMKLLPALPRQPPSGAPYQ